MKNKKLFIILVIIVLVLIAFFTTKIILENKYNSKYDKILEADSWTISKIIIYDGEKETTLVDIKMMLDYNDGNLKVCNSETCYETTYSLSKETIEIEKYKDYSFNGTFNIEIIDEEQLVFTKNNDNGYMKYYLIKPMG